MAATVFHWALHPRAIYAVLALALALFSYNKGLPFGLLAFVLILGPTAFLFSNFFESISAYLVNLPALSNLIGREDVNFSKA